MKFSFGFSSFAAAAFDDEANHLYKGTVEIKFIVCV